MPWTMQEAMRILSNATVERAAMSMTEGALAMRTRQATQPAENAPRNGRYTETGFVGVFLVGISGLGEDGLA